MDAIIMLVLIVGFYFLIDLLRCKLTSIEKKLEKIISLKEK